MLKELDKILLIKQIDKAKMLKTIGDMPQHLEKTFFKHRQKDISFSKINSVLFFGLGGSAIAGELICQELFKQSRIPAVVVKRSLLPAFVNKNTLCFALSYSGNTKETLSCYREAIKNKAKVIAITSGGELKRLSTKNKNPVVKLPSNFQPRAALGLIIGATLRCLEKTDIFTKSLAKTVKNTVKLLSSLVEDYNLNVETSKNLAKKIAYELYGQLPLIYASESLGMVTSARWKNQFNENAKVAAFCNEFPELSHNEIMAENKIIKPVLLYLKNPNEKADQIINNSISLKLMKPASKKIIEIASIGESMFEKMLSTILLGDFVSTYLAILNKVDPSPVDAIITLKKEVRKKIPEKKAVFDVSK